MNPHAANMTRETLLTAIREGIPFVIKMADGEKYEVRDAQQISVGSTNIAMFGPDGVGHWLPLLTVTGISYLPPTNSDPAP